MNTATPVLPADPDSTAAASSAVRTAAAVLGLAFAWMFLTLVCIVVISMPDSLGASHPVSFSRAVFTAVNAGTHCGFTQQFATTADFAPAARRFLAIETAAGIVFSLAAGALVLRRVFGLQFRTRRLIFALFATVIVASLAGLAALPSGSAIDRCLAGIAALGGGGPPHHLAGWSNRAVQLVMTPLALLGSVGVLGVLAIFRKPSPATQSLALRTGGEHIGKVLLVAAVAYTAGLVLQFALANHVKDSPLAYASSGVLAARGFGTPIDFASGWPHGWIWPMLGLALLGTGTLGAMPSLGFAWLVTFPRGLWPRILILLAIQAAIVLLALVVLSRTELQLSPDRLLLLVLSAAGKAGLSHEAVSIDGPGLLVLASVMASAKLLPLGLLVPLYPTPGRPGEAIQ